MSKKNTIAKYLANFSEPEASLASALFQRDEVTSSGRANSPVPPTRQPPWDFVVAVPSCGEGTGLLNLFESTSVAASRGGHKVLIVLVINERIQCDPAVSQANQATLELVTSDISMDGAPISSEGAFLHEGEPLSVLVIDRFSPGRQFAVKQGVGLARKIGCDVACALIDSGIVTNPVIFNTDGDATLPSDYFDLDRETVRRAPNGELLCPEPSRKDHLAGAVYLTPFVHESVSGQSELEIEAAQLYERYLHYYVRGLEYAGSPYAFHSIGSTIAFDAESYATVRGFPKRMAGEDFYILNKLAKVAPIYGRQTSPIRLEGRTSQRVPFGTGSSVAKIATLLAEDNQYCVHHPTGFRVLGHWIQFCLKTLDTWKDDSATAEEIRTSAAFGKLLGGLDGMEVADLDGLRDDFSSDETLEPLKRAIQRHGDKRRRKKEFFDWFDGFRTLKMLNRIRDGHLGTLPLDEACQGLSAAKAWAFSLCPEWAEGT